MKWTNSHNLPQSLFNAITKDEYKPKEGKRISVTSLLKPAQARAIEVIHADGIVQDVADHIYRLLGQSVHSVLDKAAMGENNSELHFESVLNGWTVSGYVDILEDDGTLSDFKVTSTYSFLLGDKPEWTKQLNIYRWLAEKGGRVVNKLRIVAILRDWQKSKYEGQEGGYPEAPALSMPIERWPMDKIESFVAERIEANEKASMNPSSVPCTPEERWERVAKVAVMQAGKKRALRLLPTLAEANAFIKETGLNGLSVEERPALQRRCESFCLASPWCEQRKALGVEIKADS
jgi:hypothetical protein